MKKRLPLVFSALFIFIHIVVCANEFNTSPANISDSLLIKKNNSDKIVVVQSGRKIKIWTNDQQKIKGIFKSLESDSLILIAKNKEEISILIEDIQKLKVMGKEVQRAFSTFFTTAGIAGIAGGVLFIGASAGDDSGIGGAIAVGYAAVAGGFGLLNLITGILLSGKKYNLMGKWSIQINQPKL